MNNRVVRVLQKANRRGFGHQLVQQRERLRPQLAIDLVEAREVTSRPIETCSDQPPARVVDQTGFPPSGIRPLNFGPQRSQFRSAPAEGPSVGMYRNLANRCSNSRPPASPAAAPIRRVPMNAVGTRAPQRVSICTLRPMVQPDSASVCKNAPMRACNFASSDENGKSTPMRRIF